MKIYSVQGWGNYISKKPINERLLLKFVNLEELAMRNNNF